MNQQITEAHYHFGDRPMVYFHDEKLKEIQSLERNALDMAISIANEASIIYSIEMLKNWKKKQVKTFVAERKAVEVMKSGISFLSFDFVEQRIHSYKKEIWGFESDAEKTARKVPYKPSDIRLKLDKYNK
jgi:hypothetical protein